MLATSGVHLVQRCRRCARSAQLVAAAVHVTHCCRSTAAVHHAGARSVAQRCVVCTAAVVVRQLHSFPRRRTHYGHRLLRSVLGHRYTLYRSNSIFDRYAARLGPRDPKVRIYMTRQSTKLWEPGGAWSLSREAETMSQRPRQCLNARPCRGCLVTQAGVGQVS